MQSVVSAALLLAAFLNHAHCNELKSIIGIDRFPGISPSNGQLGNFLGQGFHLPLNERNDIKAGVLFGFPQTSVPIPADAFVPVRTLSGAQFLLPKGVYSSQVESDGANGNFRLPDLTNPLSLIGRLISGESQHRQQKDRVSGVFVPLPFGLRPISLQVRNEVKDDSTRNIGLGANEVERPHSYENPLISAVKAAFRQAVSQHQNGRSFQQQQLYDSIPIDQRRNQLPQPAPDEDQILATSSDTPGGLSGLFERMGQSVEQPGFNRRLVSNLIGAVRPFLNSNSKHSSDNSATTKPLGKNNGTSSVPLGSSGTRKTVADASGVYVDLPGLVPLYLGGLLDTASGNKQNFG